MTQTPEVWSAPSQPPNFGPQDIPEQVAHAGNLPSELGGERPVVEDVTPLTHETPIDIPQDTRSITWRTSEAEAPSVSAGAGQPPESTSKGRGLNTKAKAAIGAGLAAVATVAGVLVATSGNSNNTAPKAVASASPTPSAETPSAGASASTTASSPETGLPTFNQNKQIDLAQVLPTDKVIIVPVPNYIPNEVTATMKLPAIRTPLTASPDQIMSSVLATASYLQTTGSQAAFNQVLAANNISFNSPFATEAETANATIAQYAVDNKAFALNFVYSEDYNNEPVFSVTTFGDTITYAQTGGDINLDVYEPSGLIDVGWQSTKGALSPLNKFKLTAQADPSKNLSITFVKNTDGTYSITNIVLPVGLPR